MGKPFWYLNGFLKKSAHKAPFILFHQVKFDRLRQAVVKLVHRLEPAYYFQHITIATSLIRRFEPDGSPVIAILHGSGGSDPDCSSYSYYFLEENLDLADLRQISGLSTPQDFDRDGNVEFTKHLGRHEYYAPESEQTNWENEPAILTWREGELFPACKKFDNTISEFISWNKEQLKLHPSDPGWQDKSVQSRDSMGYRMEYVANIALSYAQMGKHDQARIYGLEFANGYRNPSHPILDILETARELDHLQCPVSAAKYDDPHWRVQ